MSNRKKGKAMVDPNRVARPRTILMVLGGLAGAAVAVWNFVTPLTGVTGTFGAGLVIASSVLIVLAAILIQLSEPGGWRTTLRVLVALGVIGTAAAGYFLHEWWLIAAMAVTAIGLIYDIASSRASNQTGAYA
jgi:drug/metabolite transporter (DMT)-like permease